MWATVQARAFAAASCPFTVAHVSLGWPQAIVISGASGVNAGYVNGCFDPTNELKNGKKVYSKAGSNGSIWLFWANDKWIVGRTDAKDAGKAAGWAHSLV